MQIAKSTPPACSPPTGRRRILIVDDEPRLLRTLQMLLEEEFDADIAASAASAREHLFDVDAYDAILCDVALRGGESGIDVFEWLVARSPEAARRVIFMSGGIYSAKARTFLSQIPNARLDKPFTLDQIIASVRAVAVRT